MSILGLESAWMTSELEGTFRELGLTQYLDAFVDQGFDTWDIILDIQESDLYVFDTMGHFSDTAYPVLEVRKRLGKWKAY